jgi:hypothetical protein
MTDSPPEIPAAFSGQVNGSPSSAQQTAENTARIAALLAQIPQAIGMMLAQVARAIPSGHLCATCLANRIAWEAANRSHVEAAIAGARAAHGLAEGDPVPPGFDPAPFLPADLRPGAMRGMPPLTAAITTVAGTDTCSEHIPGRAGGRTLLVASGALSPSGMARFGT